MLTWLYEGYIKYKCKFTTRLRDLRISEHNKQGNTEIVVERSAEKEEAEEMEGGFFFFN